VTAVTALRAPHLPCLHTLLCRLHLYTLTLSVPPHPLTRHPSSRADRAAMVGVRCLHLAGEPPSGDAASLQASGPVLLEPFPKQVAELWGELDLASYAGVAAVARGARPWGAAE
jgi:hypothetical protein